MAKGDMIIGGGKSYNPSKVRKEKNRIAKTVTIPVSQLVKAHNLLEKMKKIIEELKDCVTITY